MGRWIATYTVIIGESELFVQRIVEAETEEKAREIAEKKAHLNSLREYPFAYWKFDGLDDVEEAIAVTEQDVKEDEKYLRERLDENEQNKSLEELVEALWEG